MVWSSKRILIITTIIAMIALGCSYVWHAHRAAEDLKAMMAKGKLEAEIAVEKNRTTYHRLSNDLALLFVDKLPVANTCYDAAISNYIEDQWNVLLAANGCSSMKEMCNKGPNAERSLEESMKWISDDSVHDKRALAIKIANIWYIAAQLYNYTRQLHYALDPNAEEQSFSGEENQKARAAFLLKEMADHHLDGSSGQQRLDRLSYYIASCKMHQPVSWLMADGPDDMAILQNAIKIGLQSLLLGYFATQALPAEDRGYVGCLETLTSIESSLKKCNDIKCAESVKADTRDVLKAQLDDFRDHKCYFGYLTQKQLMKH